MPRPTELPAHALRAEDFEHTPVWRYLVPDEASEPDADESFVRAHTLDLDLGDCASYLVKATITLKSGLQLPGFMELTLLDRKVEWTPGVVFAGGKAVEALGKDTAVRLDGS